MIDGRCFPFFPLAFGPSFPAADALVLPRTYRLKHPPPPNPKPFAHRLIGDSGCETAQGAANLNTTLGFITRTQYLRVVKNVQNYYSIAVFGTRSARQWAELASGRQRANCQLPIQKIFVLWMDTTQPIQSLKGGGRSERFGKTQPKSQNK